MTKRVVLVTGGGRGIGEAISVIFGKNGDIVVVNYLSNEKRAREVVAKIKEADGEAIALKADISRHDEAFRMVDDIVEKKGIIINVSSLSGITGLAGQSDYSAAKGGVIAFIKAIAKELAQFGILVNAVAPGVIDTEMIGDVPEAIRKKFLEMIPLKRFGKPEEVAGIVKFLASPEASYITGEAIVVSGGLP